MPVINRLSTGWKAVWQLGMEQVGLNALYRLGLRAGVWRRMTPAGDAAGKWEAQPSLPGFARLPALADLRPAYRQLLTPYAQAADELLREADEICAGRVRLFGAEPAALDLDPGLPLLHWSEYERGKVKAGPEGDIKFVWEPARFGWAFTLVRAYLLSNRNGFAQYFWEAFQQFTEANPANLGPNWASGQEVALRLIALLICLQVFNDAPATTPDRRRSLLVSAVQHARRIPPTLLYARSQHNNHLITEALGLYMAGLLLEGQPEAGMWKATGWDWLERGLRGQIAPDGTYAQHSSNYHRLMLQAALWGGWLARQEGRDYSPDVRERLAAATVWLVDHMDRESGRASNLGANDGAYILPLASGGFADYRPTAQAAGRAFLGRAVFLAGAWDEFSFWLGLADAETTPAVTPLPERSKLAHPGDRRLESMHSWASLRAAHFSSRPSHADQMHVDLWMQGVNVALDAGTYRYTARAPWENALAATRVHNTVTLEEQDQMLRAGRFLWLDWAQAQWKEVTERSAEAAVDEILQLGIVHTRKLAVTGEDAWQVEDQVLPAFRQKNPRTVVLHWLLPDWPWYLDGSRLLLTAPFGTLALDCRLTAPEGARGHIRLIREGKSLLDSHPADPILGWYSPTYAVKAPALSLQITYTVMLPASFCSQFAVEESSRSGIE